MNKYGLGALVLVILVVLGGLWYTSRPATAPTEETVEVLVKIGDAGATLVTVPAGATALQATEQVAEVTQHGEGEAAVVTALDGVVADDSKRQFWKLIVNDRGARVDAGVYVVQPDDTLAWEIDTY